LSSAGRQYAAYWACEGANGADLESKEWRRSSDLLLIETDIENVCGVRERGCEIEVAPRPTEVTACVSVARKGRGAEEEMRGGGGGEARQPTKADRR
jgi:hypothetical protein